MRVDFQKLEVHGIAWHKAGAKPITRVPAADNAGLWS